MMDGQTPAAQAHTAVPVDSCYLYPEREALRALCHEIFALVAANASHKQWADWLRVPVEHAAAKGNLELVSTLLSSGGTGAPGQRGCRGRTLLDAAAEGGNERVVLAILKAGAKPDISVRSGSKRRSALHRAALHGHEAAARALMMAGADVGSLDADKRGPLALAVRGGHENLVCSLLLGGASPSAKDKKGDTPLHLAAWRGRAGIASALLLKGAQMNALDSEGRTPLIVAAEHGAGGSTDALLMANADTDVRYGENELSSLDSAASHGHIGVLRALVHHGVDVNAVDSTGYTALHMAADNNQSAAVDVLVEAGADIESPDIHQWTPLHCAARYNSCCDVVLALLKRGANIDARESAGEYPLHVASQYLADKVVDLLLRWGADETKTDGDGNVPAEVIGTYASEEDAPQSEEERGEVEERLRRLLVGAPSDRAWRRRGWVVLCRNRVLLHTSQRQGFATREAIRQPPKGKGDPTLNDDASESVGGVGAEHHAAKVPRTAITATAGAGVGTGGNGSATATATPPLHGHEPRDGGAILHIVHGRGGNENEGIPFAGARDPTQEDGFESETGGSSACEVVDDAGEGGEDSVRSEGRRNLPGALYRLIGLAEEGVFREIVGFL